MNSNFNWTACNNTPKIALWAKPKLDMTVSIWIEYNLFSEDTLSPRETEKVYYWKIDFTDKKLSLIHTVCSLDTEAFPRFMDLEDCKKDAEKYYLAYLQNSLESEIAEAKEVIASRTKALRILRKPEK